MFKFKNNILTLGASDVYIFNNLLRIKGVYAYGGRGRAGWQEKRECRSGRRTGRIASQGLWPSPLPSSPILTYFWSLLLSGEELRLHLKGPDSLEGRACPKSGTEAAREEESPVSVHTPRAGTCPHMCAP